MILYTCAQKKRGGRAPRYAGRHPCGWAATALDDAGHEYEVRAVEGYRLLPWTRRGKRGTIRTLTGQEDVPVLVFDDGDVVVGSAEIVEWARSHPGASRGARTARPASGADERRLDTARTG